jgi:hypothetical protein
VTFWNRYGRTIYNATQAQLAYNASYVNGTARPQVVLRTTSQSRIENSQINWALGFFGPSFTATPNPTLANWTSPFSVVIIPEGGTENNTLASYDSCFNDNNDVIGYLGDDDLFTYIPKYLGPATARLQQYAPSSFELTVNDTYAMQSICAYEYNYIGMSSFCNLFTADEWAGFENTLDMECKSNLPPLNFQKLTTHRLLRLQLWEPNRSCPGYWLPSGASGTSAARVHHLIKFICEFHHG